MTGRRGWQIAGVAVVWLTYGGFMLWPTIHDHIGDRAYALPLLAVVAALSGGATVAAWRAIVARRPRLTHWETRLHIESLFCLLLAVDLFAVDLLAAVATRHSLVDAPFAQVGWVTLVVVGVATLLIVVGGLITPMPMPMPMPMPQVSSENVTAPVPSAETTSLFRQKILLLTRADAIRQLQIIGIASVAILLYSMPLPPWVAGLFSNTSISWAIWDSIALYPGLILKSSSRHHPNQLYGYACFFGILTGVGISSIYYVSLLRAPSPHGWILGNSIAILYTLVLVNLLLGAGDSFRFAAKGLLDQASASAIFLTTSLIYIVGTSSRFIYKPPSQSLDFLQATAYIVISTILLSLYVFAAIRALRTPIQSEVAA
ncbi:MAG: hypothetical protein H0X24_20460 [Ktedonobacterales bacterium]|nr:hypothetical protein [Ktedonobacterales bacterium]